MIKHATAKKIIYTTGGREMKAERAEEIAARIRVDYAISMGAKEAIKQAILQACAEQREINAKIAENFYGAIGLTVAAAIRSAE